MITKQRIPRRRMRRLGLALVAVLAFGAVAASGAQALTWQFQKGMSVLGETQTVAGTAEPFTITSKLLGSPVAVTCSNGTTSGTITPNGQGSSTISFNSCKVSEPHNCSLAAPLTLHANLELAQVGGVMFQKYTQEGTNSFGTLEFAGALCPLAEDSAELRGSFAGRELSSLAAEPSVNRGLTFTKSEPWPEVALKFGGAAATLTGGEVLQHLSGNRENGSWKAIWQETHGGWEVEGEPFHFTEAVPSISGSARFSFYVAGNNLVFSCGQIGATSAELIPGGTENLKGLTFSSCKGENGLANCTVNGSNALTFNNLTGTPVQVGGKTYMKFALTTGTEVARLYFTGGFCPLAEGWERHITGSFAGLAPELGAFKSAHPFEFSDAANEATGTGLQAGSSGVFHMTGNLTQASGGIGWAAF